VECTRTIYHPQKSSWIVLLLAGSPIIALGIYCFIDAGWWEGSLFMLFAAILVGYNGTMRLEVDRGILTFRRYGRTVWSVSLANAQISSGKGGDGHLLAAYVISEDEQRVGFLLKGWFSEDVIRQIERLVALRQK